MIKRYYTEIPLIRKSYNSTKSARFKGMLKLVSNEMGVIYDWNINFESIDLDIMTTESWFVKKTSGFKRREELFMELGLNQIKRPERGSNKIVVLDSEQLGIVNNFINDRTKYNSTIKNVVQLLKGNNPGGEFSKYKSAELVIDTHLPEKNFAIMIDKLVMKKGVEFAAVRMGAETIKYKDFFSLNESIKEAFSFIQKDNDESLFGHYIDGINQYYKEFNVIVSDADRVAKKARAKYSTNIDKENEVLPFGFVDKGQYQKCHIYEFHDLRDEIINALKEKKSYEKYVRMIQDPENFIPLPNEVHRKFDGNYFTYKINGDMWAINEDGYDYINKFIDDKYKKIPEFFLTKKRKEYLELRNKNINW